jgi:hypothetical protein
LSPSNLFSGTVSLGLAASSLTATQSAIWNEARLFGQPVTNSLLRCLLSSISTANQSSLPPTWQSVQSWFSALRGDQGAGDDIFTITCPLGTELTQN